MGEVFLVRDVRLGRPVALKLMRTRFEEEDARSRMLREAQALARLAHPNVVVVYDVGMLDDDLFIAMEYVSGESLKTWIGGPRRR